MPKFNMTFLFVTFASLTFYGCSKAQMAGGGKARAKAASNAGANLPDGVATFISGEKKSAKVLTKIRFTENVAGFDANDILVIGARAIDFRQLSPSEYEADFAASSAGEVTISIPAGVAKSTFSGKDNQASETLDFYFTPVEIDASVRMVQVPIGKVETSDPVKLVLIVDDSASRKGDQTRLAAALKASLATQRYRNIQVFAYSTTPIGPGVVDPQSAFFSNGASSVFVNYAGSYAMGSNFKTSGTYFDRWVKSAVSGNGTFNTSKYPFLHRKTEFIKDGIATPWSPTVLFNHQKIVEKYHIGKSAFPNSTNGSVTLSSSMSDADFNAVINQISTTISSFGENGSLSEYPLCSLVTALQNDGPYSIFNQNDKVSFLIMTDEDNEKHPLTCLAGYENTQILNDFVKVYPGHYNSYISLKYEEQADNGSSVYLTRYTTGTYRKSPKCIENGVNRCTRPTTPCSTEQLEAEYSKFVADTPQFSSGVFRLPPNAQRSCDIGVFEVSTSFPGSFGAEATLVRPSTTCNQVGFDVKIGANIINIPNKTLLQYMQELPAHAGFYFTNKCNFLGSSLVTQANEKWIGTPGVTEAGGLGPLIKAKADALFGLGKYSITAIANLGSKNPASCSANASAESTDILAIANNSISICESSYDGAFTWFDQFARYNPKATYSLDPIVREVVSVRLSYMKQPLLPEQYRFEGGVLTIVDVSVLRYSSTDTVEVAYRE